jgi:hypothetical protein
MSVPIGTHKIGGLRQKPVNKYNIPLLILRPLSECVPSVKLSRHKFLDATEGALRGFVYVFSNPAMPGLLKIGFTTTTVAQRLSQLSIRTGVPKPFEVEFFAHVDRAHDLEQRIHKLLHARRYGKEFFQCDVRFAVKTIKDLLKTGKILLIDHGGRSNNLYLTPDEEAAIAAAAARRQREAEQRRRADGLKKLKQEQHADAIARFQKRFDPLALKVDAILERAWKAHPTNKYSAICLPLAVVAYATIVGKPIAKKMMGSGIGLDVGKGLSADEVACLRSFVNLVDQINLYDCLEVFTNFQKTHSCKHLSLNLTPLYLGPQKPDLGAFFAQVLIGANISKPVLA